ncbi:MAG TPA: carbamoyltransferase HypF, partial [Longimicrobiales bacterium]|nr:carbamoyltransferase HypF [Longimicrobiales bacterium]
AVQRLRARKHRYGKPLALMVADLSAAQELCSIPQAAAAALLSRERPIVLLGRHDRTRIADAVAPRMSTLGVMLPYTPLHHLLLRAFGGPLVMTSGNLSEEPIATGNQEALTRLADIADAFLLHDRDIYSRYDDSVVRLIGRQVAPIRRARSFAPAPIALPFSAPTDILAFGAQQKSTFCLVTGDQAYVSQHIGELDNLATGDHFHDTLELYLNLFRAEPQLIAHDLHPDYMSTAAAQHYPGAGLTRVGVQHHHAHTVSCMAEHGLSREVIGVSYDGTGLGLDGAVWGGEIMTATWRGFQRQAHLKYVPLLGSEAAIRQPLRMAASHLWAADPQAEQTYAQIFRRFTGEERRVLRRQFESGFNSPLTSSCGRLFDAVAALLRVCDEASYEGQPAVELEAIADPSAVGCFPYDIVEQDNRFIIDPSFTLSALWHAYRGDTPIAELSTRFHNTVAAWTADACRRVRDRTGIDAVCLSGGCFQNALLSTRTQIALEHAGFQVYTHQRVPANDGGISLGQAVVAYALTH